MKILVTLFLLISTMVNAAGYNIEPENLVQEIHEINNVIFDYKDIDKWDILINGTISAETLYGQYSGNGNLSLAQISKAGFGFIQSRLTDADKEKLSALGYENDVKFAELKKDNRLAIIYCALYYKYKLQEVPPQSLEECAKVWKKYYNTIEGKGRPKDFIVKFKKYGLKYVMNFYTEKNVDTSELISLHKAFNMLVYNYVS